MKDERLKRENGRNKSNNHNKNKTVDAKKCEIAMLINLKRIKQYNILRTRGKLLFCYIVQNIYNIISISAN